MKSLVDVKLTFPISQVKELREGLNIPEEIPDEEMMEYLVGNIVDRFLAVEHSDLENVREDLHLCFVCNRVQDDDGRCRCTNRDSE